MSSYPDPFALQDLLGPTARLARRALTGEHGVALPAFTDHHVHSTDLDPAAITAGGIAGALDLGADPDVLFHRRHQAMPRVAYAGATLTTLGGYPAGQPWAPAASTREVAGHAGLGVGGGAETAVDEQAEFGASVIKVALNAAAGPVFDLATLRAVVSRAHERGLPVVAHAEGEGMTVLALDAGIDALAHTPFSEALTPATILRAVDAGQLWISTLAIHAEGSDDAERAASQLASFHAAGGRVLYGTDLASAEQHAGVDARELAALSAAGVRGAELIATLADPWPLASAPDGVTTFIAGPPALDDDAVPAWLARARVVAADDLIPDDH